MLAIAGQTSGPFGLRHFLCIPWVTIYAKHFYKRIFFLNIRFKKFHGQRRALQLVDYL